MSLRPSATAIGAFVIGTLVLVVGSLAFFGSNLFGSGKDLRSAVVIFTGSVKGLNVGAPVTLRGVKIGRSPARLTLPPGRHVIELRPFGTQPPQRATVNATSGETARLSVPVHP